MAMRSTNRKKPGTISCSTISGPSTSTFFFDDFLAAAFFAATFLMGFTATSTSTPSERNSSMSFVCPSTSNLVNPFCKSELRSSDKSLPTVLSNGVVTRNRPSLKLTMKSTTSATLCFFTCSPEMGEKVLPMRANSNLM